MRRRRMEQAGRGGSVGGCMGIIVSVVLSGCSVGGGERADTVVTDSAGVRVVAIPDRSSIVTTEVPRRSVEEIHGFDDAPLAGVRSLAWTGSGHVLVADGGSSLVTVSARGELLYTVGGEGEGPGEFLQLHAAAPLSGGGSLVYDSRLGRASEYGPDGSFERAWPLQGPSRSFFLAVYGATSSGFLYGVTAPSEAANERRPGRRWATAHLLLVTERHVDTVAEFVLNECDEARTDRCVPSGLSAAVAATGDRLVVAPRDWAELRVYERGVGLRAVLRASTSEVPPFTKAVMDDEGNVWFGHAHDPRWRVWDGSEFRRFAFPGEFELWDVRDQRALGVTRDELGVQRVAVVPLPPPAPSGGQVVGTP